jgi:outer membrane protein OmpA-like peptidoglycan-associated protein
MAMAAPYQVRMWSVLREKAARFGWPERFRRTMRFKRRAGRPIKNRNPSGPYVERVMKALIFPATRRCTSSSQRLQRAMLLVVGLCAGVPATAGMTGIAASWSFQKDQRQCVLEQHSSAGVARFAGEPGLDLRFEFIPVQDPFGDGDVHLSAEAPEWHPAWPDVDERGVVDHVRGGSKTIRGDAADRLLRDLHKGRLLRLTGRGPFMDDDADVHTFVVMPTRFGASHDAFSQCRHWEMPGNFADMEHVRISFGSGEIAPSAADRSRLDALAAYVLADRRLIGIRIDGHSDARGSDRSNRTVSKHRAASVANHLVRRGIPRALLTVHAHGAQFPQADGPDEASEARNRRVTIQLQRVDPHHHERIEPMQSGFASAGRE